MNPKERSTNCGPQSQGWAEEGSDQGWGRRVARDRRCARIRGGSETSRSAWGCGPRPRILDCHFLIRPGSRRTPGVSSAFFHHCGLHHSFNISFPACPLKPAVPAQLQHAQARQGGPSAGEEKPLLAHPHGQPQEGPLCPPVSLPLLGSCPLCSRSWRNRCEQRRKRNKTSFPPPQLPRQNHILLPL